MNSRTGGVGMALVVIGVVVVLVVLRLVDGGGNSTESLSHLSASFSTSPSLDETAPHRGTSGLVESWADESDRRWRWEVTTERPALSASRVVSISDGETIWIVHEASGVYQEQRWTAEAAQVLSQPPLRAAVGQVSATKAADYLETLPAGGKLAGQTEFEGRVVEVIETASGGRVLFEESSQTVWLAEGSSPERYEVRLLSDEAVELEQAAALFSAERLPGIRWTEDTCQTESRVEPVELVDLRSRVPDGLVVVGEQLGFELECLLTSSVLGMRTDANLLLWWGQRAYVIPWTPGSEASRESVDDRDYWVSSEAGVSSVAWQDGQLLFEAWSEQLRPEELIQFAEATRSSS